MKLFSQHSKDSSRDLEPAPASCVRPCQVHVRQYECDRPPTERGHRVGEESGHRLAHHLAHHLASWRARGQWTVSSLVDGVVNALPGLALSPTYFVGERQATFQFPLRLQIHSTMKLTRELNPQNIIPVGNPKFHVSRACPKPVGGSIVLLGSDMMES